MDLALDDHRIDQPAEIVGRDKIDKAGLSGAGIDLEFADVCARREREIRRIVERALLEARLHSIGQVVRGVGGERHHR